MQEMKINQTVISGYVTKCVLEGEKDPYARLVNYNNILFHNIHDIVQKKMSYILINEIKNGGVIYSWRDKAKQIFEEFQNDNPNKIIEGIFYQESHKGDLVKIGFIIKEKLKAGFYTL